MEKCVENTHGKVRIKYTWKSVQKIYAENCVKNTHENFFVYKENTLERELVLIGRFWYKISLNADSLFIIFLYIQGNLCIDNFYEFCQLTFQEKYL